MTKYWIVVASKDHVKSWGYPFRFGFFEINQHDFDLISSQMLQHHYV